MSGALALIERTGSEEAVTLRAVAREVGIAAPSIYAHFADRDAILMAVVVRVFDELTEAIEKGQKSAGAGSGRPPGRGLRGVRGLRARAPRPLRRAVLHAADRQRRTTAEPVPIGPDGRPVLEYGAESFALLVQAIEDCVTAGVSASTDVVADATAVWVAMHGTVSLRTALPRFPWPDPAAFVRQFVLLAGPGDRLSI